MYTDDIYLAIYLALRIVNNIRYRDSSNPFFVKCKMLKFYDIVDYDVLQVLQRTTSKILLANIQDFFLKSGCQYNMKGSDVFKKPRLRTKVIERTVSNLWNALHREIKLSKSIVAFKKQTKTTILNKYKSLI